MLKDKYYLKLDSKDLTLQQLIISNDDFGKTYIKNSTMLIEYGECKKYVNPICHFIFLANKHIQEHENWEVAENKTIEEIFNLYNKIVSL